MLYLILTDKQVDSLMESGSVGYFAVQGGCACNRQYVMVQTDLGYILTDQEGFKGMRNKYKHLFPTTQIDAEWKDYLEAYSY